MSATEDAIALLRSRVDHHRIGRSTWREMDHDIIAMRKAIELLEAPTVEDSLAFQLRTQARAAGVREIANQIERQEEIGPLHDSQLSSEQREWWERNTAEGMFYGDDPEDAVRWLRARADQIENGGGS
ncbi:hypothetical protein PBI_HYPERION_67 [Microbacterium phage Hyperion]|uniref:Uncharacterized protein n=1 Tax=Microbacterium phage Hyperion TaxID=2182354 RepID=A0A2U8UIU6_9CAUD|nr:hypothetical protein HOT27_gp067 [Microbacterium phage Hyperion]AWN03582.1 hypothetical protein PBI_HYPERION_67 [Microbacterium phage Hyperion]